MEVSTSTSSKLSNSTPFIPVADNKEEQQQPRDAAFILANANPSELVKRLKPWSSFFAGDKFSRPASVDDLLGRLRMNPHFFGANYVAISFILLLYCALTHWGFLIALAVSAGMFFFYLQRIPAGQSEVSIYGNHKVSTRFLWWGWAAMSAMLFVLTGALADIFWSVGVTVIVVLVHSSLHIVQFHVLTANRLKMVVD